MTNIDYGDWIKYHLAAFPALDKWLASTDESPDTIRMRNRHWAKALAAISVEEAKRVTDQLVTGEIESPRGWSAHPTVIRKQVSINRRANREYILDKIRPQPIDNEDTFSCFQCRDSGLIDVWHVKSMKAMREGRFGEHQTDYRCVVRCECEVGNVLHPAKIKYDSATQLRYEMDQQHSKNIENLAALYGMPWPNMEEPISAN